MDDFHHQLSGTDGSQHILSESFRLYRIGKLLGYFIIDIGIEQCATYIFQGLGYVYLGNLTLAFEDLKRAFESFT